MAKVEMRRIALCGLMRDRKAILESLQRFGAVEVEDMPVREGLTHKDTAQAMSQFERDAAVCRQALAVLDENCPVKKALTDMFKGRYEIDVDEYYTVSGYADRILRTAQNINAASRRVAEQFAQIHRIRIQIEQLTPWASLDLPLNYSGTVASRAFIGTLPQKWTSESLLAGLAERAPESKATCEILNTLTDSTCVFVLCHRSGEKEVEQALRSMGFTWPSSSQQKIPSDWIASLKREIEDCQNQIDRDRAWIRSQSEQRRSLQCVVDYFQMRRDKYEALGRLGLTPNTFLLAGYVPKPAMDDLNKLLQNRFDIALQDDAPRDDEDVPVLLHNNKFSEPVETVVEMYALPNKNDIDPTAVTSIFYYILFGIMFSDAAYGAVLALVTGILIKKFGKSMEKSLLKNLKMFFWCGISTIFWGVMFGSYFGNIVNVVSAKFFGQEVSIPPLWFEPLSEPMRMLIFSFALGLIHLFTGLVLLFIKNWRNGDKQAAFFDAGSWICLLLGVVLLLVGMVVSGMPAFVQTLGIALAAIGAVLIIGFSARDAKSIGGRIATGLYNLYGVTSYLSDVLSYSRLLALGLATSVIAMVFNTMGAMVSGPAGIVVLILSFVIGHSVNIAINVLGAYVHTNRLQYVEFFGKFYEGGGRAFHPLGVYTKYFRLKREEI